MTSLDPRRLLRDRFGHRDFRPGQQEAIRNLLEGRDVVLVLPTGGGKSLCYQLPSLILEGPTVVISPLISLMQDQVQSLRAVGIQSAALNSTIPRRRQKQVLQGFVAGEFDLLYLAPERLRDRRFLDRLDRVSVSLFAIDEAHCISEWGHDFRPDYLRLPEVRERLGGPTVLASTATATPRVRRDLRSRLDLPQSTREIVSGFNRTNLAFGVRSVAGDRDKKRALEGWLDRSLSEQEGSAIVYVGTRRRSENLADYLSRSTDYRALAYHGGMDVETRRTNQDRFLSDSVDLMVSTNAFGMGIDKPDVRLVLHWDLPGTLEAYYQEAGRAGRDGDPAFCVLLYDPSDRELQDQFIDWDTPSREDLESLYEILLDACDQTGSTTPGGQPIYAHDSFALYDRLEDLDLGLRVGKKNLEDAGLVKDYGYEGRQEYLSFPDQPNPGLDPVMDRVATHRDHRRKQLESMIQYAESASCRRRFILEYFGDESEEQASVCCDVCIGSADFERYLLGTGGFVSSAAEQPDSPGWNDREELILRAIGQQILPLGKTTLAKILTGSRAQSLRDKALDHHPSYGRLPDQSQGSVREQIEALIDKGHVIEKSGRYPSVTLSESTRRALLGVSDLSHRTRALRGSYLKTLRMLRGGRRPQEVATLRDLPLSTVEDHVDQLRERGLLEENRTDEDSEASSTLPSRPADPGQSEDDTKSFVEQVLLDVSSKAAPSDPGVREEGLGSPGTARSEVLAILERVGLVDRESKKEYSMTEHGRRVLESKIQLRDCLSDALRQRLDTLREPEP